MGTNAQVFFDFSGEWRSESKFSEAEKLLPRFYGNATFFCLFSPDYLQMFTANTQKHPALYIAKAIQL